MSNSKESKLNNLPDNEIDLKDQIDKYIEGHNEKQNEINQTSNNMDVIKSNSELEDKEIENIQLQNKHKPTNVNKSYLLQKIQESGISDEIIMKIGNQIENKKEETYNKILNNSIPFGNINKSVDEIIQKKKNKPKQADTNIIEENLRIQKIKDIKENKENIENKIKSLQENIKILEGNDITRLDLNMSVGGSKEIIDDNIRKSRIKEIKSKKEILENKLVYLDEQVQGLMKEEEINNINKRFNLKQYLDNFEKDKREAELREQKWKKEQEQRIKAFEENQKKISDRLKEKADNESLYLSLKKQENYLKKLDQIKQSAKNHREDVKKLTEMKEEWKARPITDKNYLFKIAEEEFKKKQQQVLDEEKRKVDEELNKIKQNYKPISKEEIEDFKKNYEEQRQKLIYEKEKERLLRKEEIIQKNSVLPKAETQVHQKIIEEEKKYREVKEKEKMDKIYNKLKIKQFSKVIQTSMVPRIDETKKKEIEERIQGEGQRPKKHEYKSVGRVIFKKANPDKLKNYNRDLKTNNSNSFDGVKNYNQNYSLSRGILNSSILNKSRPLTGENNLRSSKSRSKDKKKPMEKNPDYLTEMRIKKIQMESRANNTNPELRPVNDKKWKKMINNNKYSLLENVEQIKLKAQMLENQAKMKGKLLHLNGGTHKNPEIGEDVSNMLIDAIKAKLTILENISTKKK